MRKKTSCTDCDGAGEFHGSDCGGFGTYNPPCFKCNGSGEIDKPRKWNLPLSYEPKIQPVIDGSCTQTIRPLTDHKHKLCKGQGCPKCNGTGILNAIPKEEGDLVRFRKWTGIPYRSPPVIITPYFELLNVEDIQIIDTGFLFYHNGKSYKELSWDDWEMRRIAERDFINPATGPALRDVLISKNGKIPKEGMRAQILEWDP